MVWNGSRLWSPGAFISKTDTVEAFFLKKSFCFHLWGFCLFLAKVYRLLIAPTITRKTEPSRVSNHLSSLSVVLLFSSEQSFTSSHSSLFRSNPVTPVTRLRVSPTQTHTVVRPWEDSRCLFTGPVCRIKEHLLAEMEYKIHYYIFMCVWIEESCFLLP